MDVPSGYDQHSYGKWTIEIGDLPLQIVIFHSYIKLPEGIRFYQHTIDYDYSHNL